MEPDTNACNIKVIVRCRPLSETEKKESHAVVVRCDSKDKHVIVSTENRAGSLQKRTFTFDTVFGQFTQQEGVFEDISSVVDEVLEGFNCTVFAYTMQGTENVVNREDACLGIIPRSVHAIFDRLAKKDAECVIHVSCLEIYNEVLVDLLSDVDMEHRIFEDATKGVFVSNLEEQLVTKPSDIFEVLAKSWERRQTGETKMNKSSSRSHTIFTVKVHSKETNSDGEDIIKIGKLNLVDLAGSECIGKSEAVGKRAKEAGNINRSLLTLGRVINALVQGHRHVPYRESKLTRLLQESLGGKAKTVLIATISPSNRCLDETLKTLDYAHTAKNITNRPEVNQKVTQKAYVRDLQVTIASYKKTLEAMRTKTGVYMPNDQFEEWQKRSEGEREELSHVQATLKECEQELEKARKTVIEQRKEINDVKAEAKSVQEEMAAAFQAEQDQLEENARAMHTDLKKSVADLGLLHTNIDRRNVLETHNTEQVKNVDARVKSAIGSLVTVLDTYISSQNLVADELQKRNTDFFTARSQSIADIHQSIIKHTSELTNVSKPSQDAATSLVANSSEMAAKSAQALSEMMSSSSKAHSSTVSGVSAECASICDLLNSQSNQVKEWSSETIKSINDFNSIVVQNAEILKEQLLEGESIITDILQSGIGNLANLKKSITEEAAKQVAAANEDAIQLEQKIGCLVQEFIKSQNEKTKSSYGQFTAHVDGMSGELAGLGMKTCSDIFSFCRSAVSDSHTQYAGSCANLSARPAAFMASFANHTAETSEIVNRLPTATSESLHRVDETLGTASALVVGEVQATVAQATSLRSVVDETAMNLNGLREMVLGDSNQFTEESASMLERNFESSGAMSDAIKKAATEFQSGQRTHLEGVHKCVAELGDSTHANGFHVYKSTSSTPTRDGRALPPSPKRGRVWSERLSQIQSSQPSHKRRRIELDAENTVSSIAEEPSMSVEKAKETTGILKLKSDTKMEIEDESVLADSTNKV